MQIIYKSFLASVYVGNYFTGFCGGVLQCVICIVQ